MAKITSIQEDSRRVDGEDYEGYAVVAGDETYFVGIRSGQSCCERWGYLMLPNNPAEYIGHELRCVTLDGSPLQAFEEVSECCAEFVNVETCNGTFQLVVYNEHSGYYGHSIVVMLFKEGQPALCMKKSYL